MITAIVLTYNEQAHIVECLKTLEFADARIVFDSGSTDDTVGLAEVAGARVLTRPFDNYAAQRNAALDAVEAGWVLFIDADERVSGGLAAEVRAAVALDDDLAGYRMPRHNYIFGKLTLGAGWYPDYQTRLLRVGRAHYDPDKHVHEVVVLDGEMGTLQQPLVHYNYKNIGHFANKQRRYSAYDADILRARGEYLKPWTLVSMPLRHFWWRYVTLGGYRLGWHGLLLSTLMARYEFRKYYLLWRNPNT